MKLFYPLLFVLLSVATQAQMSRQDYIDNYKDIAISEMKRTGIPASIKLAQACLESSNGNSELSRISNNHFGIKCKTNWTGASVKWDDDARNECFRKYNSVEESFYDHSNFLTSSPRYANLFTLAPDDYVAWAYGLKAAGYATAPDYAQRLIKIIVDFKLYAFDRGIDFDQLSVSDDARTRIGEIANLINIDPHKSHKIFMHNKLKTVVVREGDTFELLAEEFDIKTWALYQYNDLSEGYQPRKNEVIYIQKKHRRALKGITVHKVGVGETMHYISQVYGIRLKPLYRRNHMKAGQEPVTEEVIYLRNRR